MVLWMVDMTTTAVQKVTIVPRSIIYHIIYSLVKLKSFSKKFNVC